MKIKKLKNYELLKYFLYGGLSPFVFISILYIVKNEFNKLFFTLFLFPLHYSSNFSLLNNLKTLFEHLLQFIYIKHFKIIGLLSILLIIVFLYYLITSISVLKNLRLEHSRDFLKNLIILLILSSIVSFLFLPVGHWHYLIYYFFSISFLPLFIDSFKVRNILWVLILVGLINIGPLVIKGSLKNIIDLNNIHEKYEIYQDFKIISTKYQIDSAIALEDHLILFYLGIGSDNYIVHPSNYQKTSYTDSLLRAGYIKENELLHLIEDGSTDLLICSENFTDICSFNQKSYKKIKVNDRNTIFYINKNLNDK